jgi:hypothetical protein
MNQGADITDYFNYGFTEDTWKIYRERQRELRVLAAPKKVGGPNRFFLSFFIDVYKFRFLMSLEVWGLQNLNKTKVF